MLSLSLDSNVCSTQPDKLQAGFKVRCLLTAAVRHLTCNSFKIVNSNTRKEKGTK